jgi:hypothetical protein
MLKFKRAEKRNGCCFRKLEEKIVDKDVTSRGLLKEDRNDRQVWKNATSKVNPII